MQLKHKIGIAVGSLLAASQPQASQWLVEGAVMSYSEQDDQGQGRVSIFEPVFSITQENAPDDYIKFDYVYDSLTGATPNGANATTEIQTFPSYKYTPHYTPLDSNFKDTRIAMNLSMMKPIDRMSRYIVGGSYSQETDYTSAGGNYSYLTDFNNKQTTLTIGGAYTYDAVNPKVGKKSPFTSINTASTTETTTSASGGAGGESEWFSGEAKHSVDGIVGVSHVLNRYTLLNLNYGFSMVNGYMDDAYKIISVIDSNGTPVDYVSEHRPSSRIKQTLKGTMITALGRDSLHLDYRYFWDDWNVSAHTFDVKYYKMIGERFSIRPHFRTSIQSAAKFYKLSLNKDEAYPTYASADYRLADMTTTTLGGMVGFDLNPTININFNVERIKQTGNKHPAEAIGDQRLNDMFPSVTMWTYTVGFKAKL